MSPIPSPWRADSLSASTDGVPWLVAGLIPGAGAVEIFGPPKTGKSHILVSLLAAVARGDEQWYTWPLAPRSGDVWLVTAEIPDDEAAARMLDRTGQGRPPRLVIQAAPMGVAGLGERRLLSHDGYQYVQRQLMLTEFGTHLHRIWSETPPAVVAIDSATALICGFSQPDPETSITLATGLDTWARLIGCPMILTAHTSQDSHLNWVLPQRLSYSARTGSQGIAAGYAAMLGTTRWRDDEHQEDARSAGVDPAAGKTICLAQAAIRDGAEHWDSYHPAVFRHGQSGFALVRQRVELTKSSQKQKRSAPSAASRHDDKGGWNHGRPPL